ncbi:MAG: hypothetical protein NVSMB56_11990 [Pyrinomonadaceae bacterium]
MIKFFVLTLLLLLPTTPVVRAVSWQRTVAGSPTQKTPEQATHEFYRWYIHALNQNQDPLRHRRIVNKFVTAKLIQRIYKAIKDNEYDVDYFIDAQDWDKDWEKNISVTNSKSDGNKTHLSVTLDGASIPKHKLNITLRKENGVWKIEKVEGAER